MEFIPSPFNQPSFLRKHHFFWQQDSERDDLYHLYRGDQKEASLCLQDKMNKLPFVILDKAVFEFHDISTFFAACLLLNEKNSGLRAGRIEKNVHNPTEGTILLNRHLFGWKFNVRPDPCLVVMDQQRNRLFSYHYGHDYVRLLLNKPGKEEDLVIPLLCIALYLLPVWERSSGNPPEKKVNGIRVDMKQ